MNREQFYKELIEAVIEKHGPITVGIIDKGSAIGKYHVVCGGGTGQYVESCSYNFTTALILLLAKDKIINSNKKQ